MDSKVSRGIAGRRWVLAALGAVALASPAMGVEILVSVGPTLGNGLGKVMRYDAVTGAAIDTGEGAGAGVFIGPTVPGGNGGLSKPIDMRLGSDGNIYVVSNGTNSIKKYDGTNGHYLGDFVTAGSGGLSGPWGMVFGPDANHDLYVTSSSTNQVLRYQGLGGGSPGAFVSAFVTAGSGGLNTPRGLIFGNDQWRSSCGIGSAQDGYPELYVANFATSTTSSILRYNGLTGAFLDVFDNASGGQSINNIIYEQVYVRNQATYNSLNTGNLLASFASGTLNIYSGAISAADGPCAGIGNTNFNGFATDAQCLGSMAWGPHRLPVNPSDPDDSEKKQSLYWPDVNGNIHVVSANEKDCGNLVTGLGVPGSVLLKCGRNPATLIRKVVNNFLLQGTVGTITLQGDNLAALTAVSIRRMRKTGDSNMGAVDGGTIVGTNLRMSGADLLVDCDTTGAEGGRYTVLPTDSCSNAMQFLDTVIVYMPTLTNGSFEQGYVSDREGQYTCNNPGGNGNKSRPKHWDTMHGGAFSTGSQDQFSIERDGNIFTACGNGGASITGLHYGSVVNNFTNDDWDGMQQTLAAPFVVGQTSTAAYSIYVDADVASMLGLSSAKMRLYDGDSYGGTVIDEHQIDNTQQAFGDVLYRSADFKVMVPSGYTYHSSPPVLTIAFISQSAVGDVANNLALKAFHIDNVRNQFVPCPHSPWGDFDNDGDMDQDDYGVMQACYSGNANAPVTANCVCADRDQNGKVNDSDVAAFKNCALGPAVAVAPVGNCQ